MFNIPDYLDTITPCLISNILPDWNILRFLLELEVLTLHIIALIKMKNIIKNQLKNK